VPFAFVDILTDNFGEWSSGFWVTTRLVFGALAISMVVGTAVAALRIAPNAWLQRLGGVYVEFFRNIPLLVLVLLIFLGLRDSGVGIGPWTAGILALGLYTAAYVAEVLRSGVFSVSKGQIEASLSLGFTYRETVRRIVLPQAFRTVIAPMGSLVIAMIKNSAIIGASAVALSDLLKVGRILNSRTFQTFPSFFWAAVGYLILTVAVTLLFRRLELRYAIRR
jgi:His/Glu/Gln/Arg/opine family amino acid ABC transporter permease subunit